MKISYKHFSEFPAAQWHWPSFSPREMACKGTGKIMIDTDAMDRLQKLRDTLGKPIIVTSAYRSPEHNARVKGVKNSLHMQAEAFDVSMTNHCPQQFEAAARAAGFSGFGYYSKKNNFMHIDIGPARTWGTPFPLTATSWPTEAPRQPERLAEDRRALVAGGAGVAGVGVVGVEHLPAAGALLGGLAPTAQLVGVVVLAGLAAYLLWRQR